MPNPNSINFSQTPNQASTNTEVSRTRTENQSTGQKPNRAVEQEGNRFLHISREELLRVDPANLLPSERQDFIDAHQAWIDKYQKIIDEAKEKETALATEAEAASVAEAETTSAAENETATPAADLSGLDVINADQEPAQNPSAANVDPNAPTEPIPVVPSITPEDIPNSAEAANSVDRITPEALAATKEKAKQKLGLKEVFAKKVLPVVLSAAILISGIVGLNAIGKDSNSQPEGNPSTPPTEQTGGSYGNYDEYAAAGEQQGTIKNVGEISNGVHYDYREYADFGNKTSEYAYGYDKSSCFGDRDAFVKAWMEQADKGPEYLSSYAVGDGSGAFAGVFTDAEKAELGIDKMNPAELDNYLSNAQNIDGGAKQRAIQEKLSQIAHDENNTRYNFYYENDSEYSYYIVFIDANSDGEFTPEELSLGYQIVERHNAPQVDVERFINGQWVKVSDYNLECGIQPNGEVAPQGLPEITAAMTSIPGTSSIPGRPGEPEQPNQPNQPSNPEQPTTPGNPDTPNTPDTPQPKNQDEANENSGADTGIVTPEKQERQITNEPEPDKAHGYNQETNTYDYTPAEQAANIGYEVTNDINEVGQESSSITSPDEVAAAEEMVSNQTAPEMVTGTREGVDAANDFDAGATVGTGEVTGDTQSADDSGNTIQENLDNATGNQTANPTGDYSQGF